MISPQPPYENDEEVWKSRVKLPRLKRRNFVDGRVDWTCDLIWSLVGKRVKDVGQCSNSRCQRYSRAGHVTGIAAAIPPLMMMAGDLLSHLHMRDVALRKQLSADRCMRTHNLTFGIVKLVSLKQDRIGNPNLADVMQSSRQLDHVARIVIAAELLSQQSCKFANPVRSFSR